MVDNITNNFTMDFNGSSNATGRGFGMSRTRKVGYITTTCVQSSIALYVLISLLYYEYVRRAGYKGLKRHHKSSRGKLGSTYTNSSDASSTPNNPTTPGKTKSKTTSSVLRGLCIFSTILTLIRILFEMIELAPADASRTRCEDYIVPIVSAYSAALASIYFILWYRLYIFLNHPAMRHLGSKSLKIFAYIVLFLILGASIMYTVLYLTTTHSVNAYGGCTLSSTDNLGDKIRFIILTFSSVIAQASLLGLFIYPLLKHRKAMQSLYTKNKSYEEPNATSPVVARKAANGRQALSKFSSSFTSSVSRKRSRQVKRQLAIVVIIKRVMITAIVCIISDIVTGILATVLRREPRISTNLMFDSNLLVNLICVIVSFKDWRSRMSFMCCKSTEDAHQFSQNNSRNLRIKTGSNNNILDSKTGPGTPMSPGVFSAGTVTTTTPCTPANGDLSKNCFIFNEDKGGSTANSTAAEIS